MHIVSIHNRVAVALKSGSVRIYDAYTKHFITELDSVR